jgi:CubicO group peptidase (beta-lactamase class C family)
MKAIFLGRPDGKDIHRFPSERIVAGDNCFEFLRVENGIGQRIKVNDWGTGTPYLVSLDGLKERHKVRNLTVIRNDTILYEGYGMGKSASDVHASYSIAKSFTSALIGIAISEGHIGSVRDRVTDHIPELKGMEHADDLRIEHLLNMTSGIRHRLRNDAVIYYGRDVTRALPHVQFAHRPGTFQEYVNINVQLLGIILQRTTGMTPAEYMTQKLWKPLGMCSDALWTTDRRGNNLTFCCMGATALDYAKLGRLYLKNGNWDGRQLVPEEWVRHSLARDTTEGSSFGYNYGWHIGEAEYGDFMADGMYKQHVYVHPGKKIVIVLLCDRENALHAERTQWRNVFKQIVDQL